jgi:catechol 2,3-dioxygenase
MNQVGLLHFAFRLRSEDELRAAYQELKEKGVPVTFTVNHGVTKSVYFRDPDDNELEVYCDNNPEDYIAIPNAYLGMEKLDFAKNDRGLADVLAEMRH